MGEPGQQPSVSKAEILAEKQPPPGVVVCDHAGGVIHTFSQSGAHGWENPDNNRRIYDEAVSLLLSKGTPPKNLNP